jgi:hypothetical protein
VGLEPHPENGNVPHHVGNVTAVFLPERGDHLLEEIASEDVPIPECFQSGAEHVVQGSVRLDVLEIRNAKAVLLFNERFAWQQIGNRFFIKPPEVAAFG